MPCFKANVQLMQILFNSVAADGRGGWFIHLSKIWDLEPYFRDSGDSEVCAGSPEFCEKLSVFQSAGTVGLQN